MSKTKDRYNKKNYTPLNVRLGKQLVEAFKQKLKDDNLPMASFFRQCIEEYINGDVITFDSDGKFINIKKPVIWLKGKR